MLDFREFMKKLEPEKKMQYAKSYSLKPHGMTISAGALNLHFLLLKL